MPQNFATISDPEFINLQPLEINPYMTSCDIKVLYLGENRNRTFISKEAALEMSKTLRGAPIVGYYKEDKKDFRDHGEALHMDGDEVKFECLTKPYGFVPPTAEVWFQKFTETNGFGEEIEREYLMTKGYLWVGQYEELQEAFSAGNKKGQSMELEDVQGQWETNSKGMGFFIINDASFSKLCMLGDDVEPCFEGADVTITKNFSLDKDFSKTLYSMMNELKQILEEGGNKVKKNYELENNINPEQADAVDDAPETAETYTEEEVVADEAQERSADAVEEEAEEVEETPVEAETPAEETFTAAQYQEMVDKFTEAQATIESLNQQIDELLSFKNNIENERKDALIETFTWLDDNDKKDVLKNKDKYSLDEIEAKLSVISVRKKAIFTTLVEETTEEEPAPTMTFSLDGAVNMAPEESEKKVPDWVTFAQSL